MKDIEGCDPKKRLWGRIVAVDGRVLSCAHCGQLINGRYKELIKDNHYHPTCVEIITGDRMPWNMINERL